MNAGKLEEEVRKKAIEFGLDDGKNAVVRSSVSTQSFKDGGAYFGYIRPEENKTGPYYDLSFVVFPQEKEGPCIVAIVVGTSGFQNDYDLVSIPWPRRLYKKLIRPDGHSFIKNDFTNIESPIQGLKEAVKGEEDLEKAVRQYGKYILAACIADPEKDRDIIDAWLAQYARLREWGKAADKKNQDNAIKEVIEARKKAEQEGGEAVGIEAEIKDLLAHKRFVVLQGAPGTGKTYNALRIAKDYEESYLIQFHAETTYADFVWGIRPTLDTDQLKYEGHDGKLVEAIEAAKRVKRSNGRVLLIIDEINRANLANVLGPVFFLFEDHPGTRETKLKIGPHELSQLPDNLHVIATMNTSDRSLAVVDFALRRRFAWYTIRPQSIALGSRHFDEKLFQRFNEIFEKYASDDELNLQPGPSYFLTFPQTEEKEERKKMIRERLVYELMPLIKEYLAEGLMQKAADSFSQLSYAEAKAYLYE